MSLENNELNSIDKSRLKLSIEHYINYFIAKRSCELTKEEAFEAIALAVREFALDKMYKTMKRYNETDTKRVYYLSVEYLIGRSLENNLHNLGLFEIMKEIKIDGFPDFSIEEIFDSEYDPALGNGGLGRLAACYLDSMASLGLPGFGYGINYKFGLFKQRFDNGYQIESADSWPAENSPWEIIRKDREVKIPIYGKVVTQKDHQGNDVYVWETNKNLIGTPYDFPVVGYGGETVNYLRLFSASSDDELDIHKFNEGGYMNAVADKIENETISKVLYPSDAVEAGKELRLKQQYFFVACAIKDIIRRFLEKNDDLKNLSDKVCIQLNDTHPSMAIPEMMRVLMDEYGQTWDEAWEICTKTFAYTNHTLLPEALETWKTSIVNKVLPRHVQIIYEINRRFMKMVSEKYGDNSDKVKKLSIVDGEGEGQILRMANLSIVGSFSVNGVAQLHSELVKSQLVPDFNELWPEKFNNKTNGITPRRWLLHANTDFANAITNKISSDWVLNLDKLKDIEKFADDKEFMNEFDVIKKQNKEKLAKHIFRTTGIQVDTNSIFAVHAKRIHEYKRQLMTIMHVIGEYLAITKDDVKPAHPITYIFAGKAAPSYSFAKLVIKLINNVAKVINNDPKANEFMRVVYIPDYKVSVAETLIPASDVSIQSSTAGFEASGTGNMKFALNGALTIGTYDGANIEIREEVGEENFYLFGLKEEEITYLRQNNKYNPWEYYDNNPEIKRIMNAINSNMFCEGEYGLLFKPIFDTLTASDYYYVLADLVDYSNTFKKLQSDYNNRENWNKRALLNVARMGKFTSDRSISEYAEDIWDIKPIK